MKVTQGAALLLLSLWLACSPPASCYPVSGARFDGPLLSERATDNDCQRQQSVKAGSYGFLKTAPLNVLQQLTAMGCIDIEDTSILSPGSDLESLTVRREGRGGVTECRGVAVASSVRKNLKTALHAFVSDSGGKPDKPHHLEPLFFLLDSEILQQTVQQQGNITFIYSCMGVGVQCLKITFTGLMDAQDMETPLMRHNLLQRSIREADQSLLPHNHQSHGRLLTLLVVLGVTVIGIVGLIAILALCAGGSTKTYETQVSSTAPVKRAADDVARNSIIEVGETVKNGALTSNGEKQLCTNAEPQVVTRKSSSPGDATDSLDRATSPGGESESQKTKRSQVEPLPDVPLTVAKDDAKCNKQESVANEEEAGYAYARVSQSEPMEGSESEGEEEGSPKHVPPGDSSCPPDVEVSKHPAHDEKASSEPPEGESYAEVRETPRYPLAGKGRLRSATEPIEPTFVPTTRDKRAGTESATHLPLPRIPSVEVNEDITYDSIPDDMKSNEGVVPKPQVPIQRLKERLYESVDDMDEDDEGPDDMYESVPDEMKHVPSPSTPKLPVVPPLPPSSPKHFPTSPAPPASPIPRIADRKDKKEDQKKKIAKSISDSENRKRAFSFFSRKKTPSISAGVGKIRRDQEPLPDVPITLSLLSPPAIPPPSPPDDSKDDEIDQMYDQPDRSHLDAITSNLNSSPKLRRGDIDVAKAKSASLPSSMRTAGGSVFHPPNIPLPEVPEDSGSGAVVVGHPVSVHVENEPNYDVVIQDKDGDEPNYDTVNQEDILRSIGEEKEPGYDKVGGKLPSEGAEGVGPVSPDDKEAPTKVAGYGKVTSHGGDSTGVTPDHDDLGYAVVPQEFKVRKRTMSSSKTRPVAKKEGDPGYVSVKEVKEPDYDTIQQAETEPGYDSIKPFDQGSRETTPTPASAPIEEQYASVDLEAKHESRQQNVPSLQLNDDGLPSSPVPPPVPPAENLGVDLSEFTEPPIPVQLEGVHELITVNDSGYSRVLRSAGATNSGKDPPYAKIEIKDEPPYATVMKLREDVQENADFGYDSADVVVKKPSNVTEQDKSKALGYDVIGEKDDIVENGETPVSPVKSELEQNMPKLATAEGELKQPLYDSLEPAEDTTTDPLQPKKELAAEQLIDDMDDEDDRYETIDEDKRKNLRERFHKSSH